MALFEWQQELTILFFLIISPVLLALGKKNQLSTYF
jgi:hypothetical protein